MRPFSGHGFRFGSFFLHLVIAGLTRSGNVQVFLVEPFPVLQPDLPGTTHALEEQGPCRCGAFDGFFVSFFLVETELFHSVLTELVQEVAQIYVREYAFSIPHDVPGGSTLQHRLEGALATGRVVGLLLLVPWTDSGQLFAHTTHSSEDF